MEAPGQAGDLEAAGVHLRELERALRRLGARVQEHYAVERIGKESGEPLRQGEHRLREHPGVQVRHLVEGAADGVVDARMVVTERGADLARGEVEDPLAVL